MKDFGSELIHRKILLDDGSGEHRELRRRCSLLNPGVVISPIGKWRGIAVDKVALATARYAHEQPSAHFRGSGKRRVPSDRLIVNTGSRVERAQKRRERALHLLPRRDNFFLSERCTKFPHDRGLVLQLGEHGIQ